MKSNNEVTLAVLGEKIDNLTSSFNEVKLDVKSNTEFRLRFKSVLAVVSAMSAAITAIVVKSLDKIIERLFS